MERLGGSARACSSKRLLTFPFGSIRFPKLSLTAVASKGIALPAGQTYLSFCDMQSLGHEGCEELPRPSAAFAKESFTNHLSSFSAFAKDEQMIAIGDRGTDLKIWQKSSDIANGN